MAGSKGWKAIGAATYLLQQSLHPAAKPELVLAQLQAVLLDHLVHKLEDLRKLAFLLKEHVVDTPVGISAQAAGQGPARWGWGTNCQLTGMRSDVPPRSASCLSARSRLLLTGAPHG